MKWFKRHKILTVILIVVVLAVVASAAGGGKPSTSPASSTKKANVARTTNPVARIGETTRDGKFEFMVKAIECGKTVVGPNQYLQKTAQGQYCLVTLNIKNIGDRQQYFSEGDQKLLNSAGQQYSPDSTATLYNSDNSDTFLAQINPGNSVEGVLVFDIPKDQIPTTAELHDSSFSGGAKVTL